MARRRALRTRRTFLQGTLAMGTLGLLSGCGMPPALSRDAKAGGGEPSRPVRIGVLHLSTEPVPPVLVGLRQGLGNLGYAEGPDVVIEV